MPTPLAVSSESFPWRSALALVALLALLPAGESAAKEKEHIDLSPAEEYKVSLEVQGTPSVTRHAF